MCIAAFCMKRPLRPLPTCFGVIRTSKNRKNKKFQRFSFGAELKNTRIQALRFGNEDEEDAQGLIEGKGKRQQRPGDRATVVILQRYRNHSLTHATQIPRPTPQRLQ
jgi:hypothetical protein